MTNTAIKERPILFSGPMVRAILDGRKTQTRRVLKIKADGIEPPEMYPGEWQPWKNGERLPTIFCPYGQAGDRLWVRETWAPSVKAPQCQIAYCADGRCYGIGGDGAGGRMRIFHGWLIDSKVRGDALGDTLGRSLYQAWRPSIHMPRRYSRITLEVTDVRVERLQEISEADAWSEGLIRIGDDLATPNPVCVCEEPELEPGMAFAEHVGPPWYSYAGKPRETFANLWDGINNPHQRCTEDAPNGWDANPWVWAVTFKVIEGTA